MKKLLITTAIALAMTTTAQAQSTAIEYMETAGAEALMASNLLGARVYATETDAGIEYTAGMEAEWDDIGEINDVVLSQDGQVETVVLGVGGFLGIGEKNVAVPMSDLRFVSDGQDAGDWFIVVDTTAEALEAAPTFEPAAAPAEPMNSAAPEVTSETTPEVTGDGMTSMETDTDAEEMTDGEIITGEMSADSDVTAQTDMMADADAEAEMDAEAEAVAPSMEAMEEETAEVEAETAEAMEEMQAETEEMATEVEEMSEEATSGLGEMATETGEALEATGEAVDAEVTEMAETTDEAINDGVAAVEEEISELDADMTAAPEGFTTVDFASVAQEDMIGVEVYAAGDENVGEVGEVTADGVIVEVGGFLGLGEKQVLVPMDDVTVMAGADGEMRVYVNATEEALEAMPEYEAQ